MLNSFSWFRQPFISKKHWILMRESSDLITLIPWKAMEILLFSTIGFSIQSWPWSMLPYLLIKWILPSWINIMVAILFVFSLLSSIRNIFAHYGIWIYAWGTLVINIGNCSKLFYAIPICYHQMLSSVLQSQFLRLKFFVWDILPHLHS